MRVFLKRGEGVTGVVRPSVKFLKVDVVAGQTDYLEVNIVTAELCDKAVLVLRWPWGHADAEPW
ncbi:hypothetical protein [Vulcanisaeta thermophila]|uniref:hypothetical protein n=1 Tax=Vulcanisaeta thermophila TaxID=867917 RepID=UPI001EE28A4D|nr:hypothetical protein [Vulcanisaeta thermophila]